MKKLVFLLTLAIVCQACQKKQYANFGYPANQLPYNYNEPVPIFRSIYSTPVVAVENFAQQGEPMTLRSSTNATAVALSAELTVKKANVRNKIARTTKQAIKVVRKKTMNGITKIKNPAAASLILSVAGLVVSVVSVVVTAPIWIFAMGTLMGAAGLILGISALRRIKNQLVPASGKGMAITGLILGALITLAGLAILYTFAVVATYGI